MENDQPQLYVCHIKPFPHWLFSNISIYITYIHYIYLCIKRLLKVWKEKDLLFENNPLSHDLVLDFIVHPLAGVLKHNINFYYLYLAKGLKNS